MKKNLDIITLGRASVDLYGSQVGSRLENMRSFEKYIGGSPTNIACGAARLNLRAGLISRVGDEHMGRFILDELKYNGVETKGIKIDKKRLTALVMLGIRDKKRFPLIFFRENCADMALCETDIDEGFIKSTKCLVITGTHLSNTKTESAVIKALSIAKKFEVKTVLDIDYRPNLWGLSGHNDGENRFIKSDLVTTKIQKNLHFFDLIVGTEEEFFIAGGFPEIIDSLKSVRSLSSAVLVCKQGPLGACAMIDTIPENLEDGVKGKVFNIEVFNVLGAGDGFMAGLLKGWLTGESWTLSLTYANACGALAVSRHGCTPAYPSLKELNFFLKRKITRRSLRYDKELEQWHWATNRKKTWSNLNIFAFDHRSQLEKMPGANQQKISDFKFICYEALRRTNASNKGFLCDSRYGQEVLFESQKESFWVGRPVEKPNIVPLSFEEDVSDDCGGLSEWPENHVVKVLCRYNEKDEGAVKYQQEQTLKRLFLAARRNRLETILELLTGDEELDFSETLSGIIQRFYNLGIFPDWWKLHPSLSHESWEEISKIINHNDPNSCGVLLLGQNKTIDQLEKSFKVASKHPIVRGFAVGRSIFGHVAEKWMMGCISDDEAILVIKKNFTKVCSLWEKHFSKQD